MNDLKIILLAEDNPQDVELTIEALKEHNLANQVIVVFTQTGFMIIRLAMLLIMMSPLICRLGWLEGHFL